MSKHHVLLICGTINQTSMMHQIGEHLTDCACFYTPFYFEGILNELGKMGLFNFTAAAGPLRVKPLSYLQAVGVEIDEGGKRFNYDLVITCTDLMKQKKIQDKRIVLVQEGITEPESLRSRLVRLLRLPRYLANTAAFGTSDIYEIFCVASEGYRQHFIRRGARAEKIAVKGIPNFDDVIRFCTVPFPHKDKDFVLVATSNAHETFKFDNRRSFLRKALSIANGRPLVFKLHPAENHRRSIREIRRFNKDALIYTTGDIQPMIAHCTALVCQYSSVALIAAAMGREVHSDIDPQELQALVPIQNGGTSADHIAGICRALLLEP
jgi:hypothetical protein